MPPRRKTSGSQLAKRGIELVYGGGLCGIDAAFLLTRRSKTADTSSA